MVRSKIVSVMVVLSLLASFPCSAVAAAGNGPGDREMPAARGVLVATAAAPLSAAEAARYSQLQASAQENGVLGSEKGGTDAATWTIVGIVAVVLVAGGVVVAIVSTN